MIPQHTLFGQIKWAHESESISTGVGLETNSMVNQVLESKHKREIVDAYVNNILRQQYEKVNNCRKSLGYNLSSCEVIFGQVFLQEGQQTMGKEKVL